jgi:hypothetical protein
MSANIEPTRDDYMREIMNLRAQNTALREQADEYILKLKNQDSRAIETQFI